MSNYFLGQIMLTGFGFPQRGFALCNGQLLPIQQNTALFSLLGTYYGGNGVNSFALPDLRGRTPVGAGTTYNQGQVLGVENVSLTQAQMPSHQHMMNATNQAGTIRDPNNTIYGAPSSESIYAAPNNSLIPLVNTQVQNTGSGAPHSNMQPFLAINFNIALTGIFPSRS
ncbi:microcystin-dependent protein [Dyella monticola]|uniref:Microcystin-dependent protein n=1 Tax=Dyella monticola TaxID=1927958 RepID=A0A370WZT8_9GAMM|nr:tail fiber protein [Dyella monticola]RDS81683.1 microcystin-dependent protein [Dyella monticola]